MSLYIIILLGFVIVICNIKSQKSQSNG